MCHSLIYILIIFSINQSVYCSYHYVGCYTQVFHDSYFTSSFMEPTLCFRLCDTPIIYLQKTVCRCSGGGLMHYNRQSTELCSIPCTKPVDRSVQTANKCGGTSTYSAYVLDKFYTRHGHLFDYQIHFSSCELWKREDIYVTYNVTFDPTMTRSSLNKLERCAAACLDQNATTKSIAFNSDSDQCLCIMPYQSIKFFDQTLYLTILSNKSCDRYCNNTFEGSKTENLFQCGSKTNPQIWSIYDINGSCPINFIYVKELKKCINSYKNFWNSCTPPSVSFTYDGSLAWPNFLKIISRLQLNSSTVTVNFDESVVVDGSWKCPSTPSLSSSSDSWKPYYPQSRSTLYGWNGNTRYVLENGCLSESSYSSYSHRYSFRLCVTDPTNKYSLTNNEDFNETYISAINPQTVFCPPNWFDLNGRCYRMSDERKSIEQARNNCITTSSTTESGASDKPLIWLIDTNGHTIGGEELSSSPTGELVEYVSEWQARVGFFLLDTDPDSDAADTETTSTVHSLYYDDFLVLAGQNDTINTDHGAINEFQVIQSNENNNISVQDKSCIVVTRSISEEEEKPIITNIFMNNCSKPRHALCETNTLVVENFQYGCFSKPRALDLPALISKHLTHELCLSVCQELQTKLAILLVNKCYCLNGDSPRTLNITTDFQKFRQKHCGKPCPGNPHDFCGNENTIVVFQILDSRRTFTYARTPAEPFPNYVYDGCVRLNSFNQSTTYQFTLQDRHDYHPRYCLALCTEHKQKYALINNGECLCTNNPIKDGRDDVEILTGQNCTQQCAGNYFYSCGNKDNSTIYSTYLLQPKCRHGFEVAQNDQQCVYSHYSAKTSSLESAQKFCQSLGSTLAKIYDIVAIQDILPDTIFHTRLMQQLLVFYKFKFVNDTRYYWIDRTDELPDPNTISERLLKKCSKVPDSIDTNCIALQYVTNTDANTISHERCIVESADCETKLAVPVCVDQHLEIKPTLVPPISDENPAQVAVNVTVDHSCGDENTEYHLIDDYCYKISFHEVTWNETRSECQLDNAIVFVPEKSVTLQYIKSLYLRQRHYAASGLAHVGVYYDNRNRTVIQYNISDGISLLTVPDSNAVYDLCEKTFQERYNVLLSSSSLKDKEKQLLKSQPIGCAYIDLTSNTVPTIRCDEIPCNRTATVICQKLPMIQTSMIKVKREYIEFPLIDDITNLPSTTTLTDDQSLSTSIASDVQSPSDSQDNIKSIGRDFAPIFFILGILFALVLLGFINAIYNHRHSIFRHSQRRNINSVYSQLTSANEFDLN